ncbi:drug resistance transporter, EmrB/QacA subfamily [Amycolatopsis arida]|uniref:Drug resistance transporter, EmrB/QacA subfamily n=1 Tax=Amycolatopsis arida TaxID=587909 RepID=A0A1I5V4Z1_9PSEU|nr:MFS transporter [Amycolatopsis arida]TDX91152.1 EmrB/QacA subfamily drug resistance transporter [Amycolatopsis arida]SFQ02613.1 drug resistance transporter, EmrB/QacA subfamily [Amycolatopsis arida]
MVRAGATTPVVGERRGAGAVLALACVAQLLVVLDVSVINVALPSIRADLDLTPAGAQWVATAYLLAFGGLLLLGGRLADLYGRRRAVVAGLGVVTVASVVGGVAGDPAVLVAARAAQGMGGAVLAPATLTLVTTTFAEGSRRTWALAIWTATSVAGGAAGSLLGGVLTEYLSWRATLLVNVPAGGMALVAALRVLSADARPGRGRLDVPGALLATAGLAALTLGVASARDHGWADQRTLTATAAGLTVLAAFVVVEARFANEPVLPPRLLRRRGLAVGNVVMLLAAAGFQAAMWYFLTFFMQDALHYGPLRTGLGFLPHTLLTVVVGWRVTPWLLRHLTSRTLVVAGALLAAAGFAWQSRGTPDSGYLAGVLGPALLLASGGGLLNTPLTATVTAGVPAADAGAASGLMNTTKQVGGALGLSALLAAAGGPQATVDYRSAFLGGAVVLLVAAATALALPTFRDDRG